MTSEEVQDLIVCGFIKRNFSKIYFPDDLSKLIVLFFDQYHRIYLSGDALKQLLPNKFLLKPYTKPITKYFEVKQIQFKMQLFQNLKATKINFGVYVESFIMDEIQSVTLLVQLYSPETHIRYHIVKTVRCSNYNNGIMWNLRGLPHSSYFKKFNVLEFCCFVDIFHIKYKENIINDYIKPISTQNQFNHEIIIDSDTLDLLYNYNQQIFYSETFGSSNNWYIVGEIKRNDGIGGTLYFKLRLLYLPNNPRSVTYEYRLRFADDSISGNSQIGFGYNNATQFEYKQTDLKYSLKQQNHSLKIKVTLNKLKIT